MGVRLGVMAAVLVVALVASAREDAAADPAITGYPDSIAGLGDSITRAVNSNGFGDFPAYSWVTGTQAAVNPYYSRLLAAHPPISGNRYNDAVSGAQMTDLDGQAQNAVSQDAELVFVLMGANDVCTSSEATMTPVATFQAQFEAAMETLSGGLPDARIAVISIPDIYNLWDILHTNSSAQFIWNFAGICQSMLLNPTSMAPADVQRRANVRQRNIDFNEVLHDVCAEYAHCKFDDYLGFNTAFTPSHVSTLDYFHPSVAGQALIAQLAWDVAYDWSDVTPPVSTSQGATAGANISVALSASDASGVLGIEYRVGAGAWVTYESPVAFPNGTVLTWRAVDDEGNTEATHTCKVGRWPWPTEDSDCDGFKDTVEATVGTNPAVACGFTAGAPGQSENWPPDLVENNSITISDVLALKPVFNLMVPPASARFDLVPNGSITISDVLAMKPFFNWPCTP